MGEQTQKALLVILGPTASGKTRLAVSLARKLDAEIISGDSRQVYQGMNIGTGKDLDEYRDIPYHLIDLVPAGSKYDLSLFQTDFQRTYSRLSGQGKTAILCGGSGLYMQAVLQQYQHTNIPADPVLRADLLQQPISALKSRFEQLNTQGSYPGRPSSKKQLLRAIEILESGYSVSAVAPAPIKSIIFGLNPAAETRRKNISQRLEKRLEQGLIAEVQGLLDQGIPPEMLQYYGLEYKWTCLYLTEKIPYTEYFQQLQTGIHRFAKRQMTYFRKMEKDGLEIEWLPPSLSAEQAATYIQEKIQQTG